MQEAASYPARRPTTQARRATRPDPGVLTLALVLIVGLWAALSIDVVRTGFGVKGDEATYVTMALSIAHDGDLAFERADLERFWREYQGGPEGIFLKRGKDFSPRLSGQWPFFQLSGGPEARTDRLYFGKAYLFPLVAAPFVRLAGLNGFFVLHVLLLVGVLGAAYAFLAARSAPPPALLFATAFVGASITPLYSVWLTPEIFNFAIVFLALFLWLYKEVAGTTLGASRWLTGRSSDAVAAVLLGLATFSKPIHVLLILPLIGWHWWRRRWTDGLVLGLVFAIVVAASFGTNAAISGEWNYQGGERKTFYGKFPFEQSDANFANRGIPVASDTIDPEGVLARDSAFRRFRYNAQYFLVGRHFGLLPFFFPGVVALVLSLASPRNFRPWHALTSGAAGATAVALLVWLPYTWSGGGGPPGNRYFLSVYPALFFLVPPLRSVWPGLLAWTGGALFTAHILVNPFVASDRPWTNTQRGPLRVLPVELTAAYDLPAMLSASRCRIRYDAGRDVQLCYLDDNAYPPEPDGIWIAGAARAEIVIRSSEPIANVAVDVRTPIANTVRVASGDEEHEVTLRGGEAPIRVTIRPFGLRARYAYAHLLSIETDKGFVPRLTETGSRDSRFLGAQVTLEVQ